MPFPGHGRKPRKKRSLRNRAFQLICVLTAVVLGLVIVARKVSAQTPGGGTSAAAAGAPAKKARKDAGVDAAPPPAAAPAAAPAPGALTDAGGDASFDPDAGGMDYAVTQGDEDFSPNASDEEKTALGSGKVPIHREGEFRSVFAHPRFGGPTHAKVGLVIREVREFNIQTGGFEADFFLSITADKALPALNLVFTNGHEVTLTPLAETETFKVYSVTGKFSSDIDLRLYPFDVQQLTIEMEDQKAGVDQIIFEADKNRTSLDESFLLASFGVNAVGAESYKHKYPPRFDRDDLYVSRYKFTLTVDRFATSAAFSVFVPAFIIVLISLTGMWVPPDELEVRTSAGAPMLAAAVLFHYSLIQALPATGYLTHADKLMLGVYVSLLLNMASTWMLMLGDERWMEHVFKVARTAVPIITGIVMLLACIV
ncbi:MAG: hypothetical protein JWP97_5335 [Labilithrix sp.]|nr:hypothetical protein [Labilithrix sp.]